MCILAGMGTAGVPGGSLPVIMLILISIGVPGEAIGMIYGVDRILDMSRTVLNVTGDITAAAYIAHTEENNSKT
ncbi:MAG: cation:dicarboxylase symporter family transporter [Bacteroidetes bacterium]|nr:cation:dicarboxylase symporter family transporter [Bacteroidota bacterium]